MLKDNLLIAYEMVKRVIGSMLRIAVCSQHTFGEGFEITSEWYLDIRKCSKRQLVESIKINL